jgi:peptide-methionine (S)-S-oxide reductase
MTDNTETAVLGGGCFWCLEAVFEQLKGVIKVTSGYAGGAAENPGYRDVCSGETGHAEVVKIEFQPSQLSYRNLLEVFFSIHDPTTLNRQGNDVGSQYRSVIFYLDEDQREEAKQVIHEQQTHWKDPIVTECLLDPPFYPAEDYHQHYFAMHGHEPYCSLVVAPKVVKAKQSFAHLLNES